MPIEASAGDILEADHRELDQLLAELLDELARDAPDPVTTYHCLDFFWARLAVHIRAEHLVLFPAVLAAAGEAGREPLTATLANLRRDHDFFMKELARAVKVLHLIPDFGNEPGTFEILRTLVKEVAESLSIHDEMEEQRIYPLADQSPWIGIRILKELENLPSRYSGMRSSNNDCAL
jgi:iron-sulfur cluster repair protein YtfE (RIC family)